MAVLCAALATTSACTVIFPVTFAGAAAVTNANRPPNKKVSGASWALVGFLTGLVVDALVLRSIIDDLAWEDEGT